MLSGTGMFPNASPYCCAAIHDGSTGWVSVFRLQPSGQGGPREFVQCAPPNVDIWCQRAYQPVGKRLTSGRAIPISRVARWRGTGIMVPPLFWIKKVKERPRPPKRRQRPIPDSDHQSPCLLGSVLSTR
ncbi:hypothetical protein CGRA01v4_14443 [Colletotrichum graminicola]|nr:hypothetical protein CGRA01v4_14443 [Colletotrichum graminicola]